MAKRTLAATVMATLLLTIGATAASAGSGSVFASTAQSCSTSGSSSVTGGFRVTLNCSGAGFVVGYGSTLTTANQQALLLYQLYLNSGRDCSGTSVTIEPGGYEATLLCAAPDQWFEAYGTTLTDAADEARQLVLFSASIGRYCDGSSVTTVSGGYEATLLCSSPQEWYEAYGTTLSDAADEARALVLLSTSIGRYCDGSSVSTVPGGYEATLLCSRPTQWYEGLGSTLTDAAQTARFLVTLG